MAVLSEIRKRPMFLIAIIGLALFAFVIQEALYGNGEGKIESIGEVNGEEISRKEFATALDNYRSRVGGSVSEMQASNSVWNNLVRQKIYKKQLEEAGITVGEADVWNQMLSLPYVQNNPEFQTEGIFDETKLKQFLATQKQNNSQTWKGWQNMMMQLGQSSESTIYNNLVTAGLGASLKEGESKYITENTKIDARYVYVPYTSINDSLAKVTEADVKAYISARKDEFQVEDSRDIMYVKFNIEPTNEDENALKQQITKLIEDSVTKDNFEVQGFRNTTDLKDFFDENDSDLQLDDKKVQYKASVPAVVAEELFAGNEGDVVGPYKDAGHLKISKIKEVLSLPDSVEASHILIAFKGASRADEEVTRTKEEAKILADSLLTIIEQKPNRLASLAKDFSNDKGSAEKGGKYEWFPYNRMTPAFRDFCFEGNKGDVGVVETMFGYHVIKVDDQKNFNKALRLATFGRKIVASEETENTIFQKSESFAQKVSKNAKDIYNIAKEENLRANPSVGIKVLDENVQGIGKERQIVTWAFNSDTKVGSYKRFDVEGGYVVAVLTAKTPKGLMPVKKAMGRVRNTIINEKKAKLIVAKMNGDSLESLSKENNTSVRNASGVNLKSPTISGVGNEPKVVGAMFNAKENELYNKIVGDRGVYAFVVSKRQSPTELPNYDSERNRIMQQRKNKTYAMYQALKKVSEIDDNRKAYYGIQ